MAITIADAPRVTIRAVSRYGLQLLDESGERLIGIPAEHHPKAFEFYRADGVTRATPEELPLTRATLKGEEVNGEEWVVTRNDGAKVAILCTAAPIRDRGGKITGGVIGWQPLTEQKRAEKALRESEHKFATMFQQSPLATCLSRLPDGELTDVNEAWVKMMGVPRRETIGKTSLEVGIVPDPQKRMRLYEVVQERGSVRGFEMSYLTRANGTRVVMINADVVTIGGEQYLLGALHDVTDQRLAEQALRDADRRKDEFLGMLSHELRNPLAPIRNSSYMLRHAAPGSEEAARAGRHRAPDRAPDASRGRSARCHSDRAWQDRPATDAGRPARGRPTRGGRLPPHHDCPRRRVPRHRRG